MLLLAGGFTLGELLAILAGDPASALLLAFSFVCLFSLGMVLLGAVALQAGNQSAKYFLIASITHASLALADQFRLNQEAKSAAEQLAMADPLTGLNNRRAFYQLVRPFWNNALRKQRPVSVLVMDIDRFGHHWGDQVLRQLATLLAGGVRAGDILARWGG